MAIEATPVSVTVRNGIIVAAQVVFTREPLHVYSRIHERVVLTTSFTRHVQRLADGIFYGWNETGHGSVNGKIVEFNMKWQTLPDELKPAVVMPKAA